MEDPVDIRSLPGAGGYQLFLPERVATVLQLTGSDGNVLFIGHQNKMQLEWLAQKIWEQFHLLNNASSAGRARLKRKKRLTLIILVLTALIAAFNSGIARLTHFNILYLNAFAFAVGIICCMQLLKYFALGFADVERNSGAGHRISELKELILKDFS